jgi:hypothetical protein
MSISPQDEARIDILLRESQETRDAADAAIAGAKQTVGESRRLVAEGAKLAAVLGVGPPVRRWGENPTV